jgi:hypothetical protein
MNSLGHYAPEHPVSIALHVLIASAQSGGEIGIGLVRSVAEAQNVAFGCDEFDLAASFVGLHYSPTLDLYVPAAMLVEIEGEAGHSRLNQAIMAEALDQTP